LIPEQTPRRRQRRWDRVSWWYSLLLVAALLGVVAALVWSGDSHDSGLSGVVKDAYTGKPVANALVSTATATA
jgi:hypothetical protein